MLPPEHDGDVLRWLLPNGEARFDPHTGTWSRPGFSARIGTQPPTLRADLDEGDVVIVLSPPIVVVPGKELSLRMGWPLVIAVMVDGVVVDRFRPGAGRTLVGTAHEGRVMPAVRPRALEGEIVQAWWEGALRLRIQTRTDHAVTFRRIVATEEGLDVWQGPDGVLVGDLRVTATAHDRASSRADTPTLPGDAELIGRVVPRNASARGVFGWSGGDTRTVEFVP